MAMHPDLAALFVALSLVSMFFAVALAQTLVSLGADLIRGSRRLTSRS